MLSILIYVAAIFPDGTWGETRFSTVTAALVEDHFVHDLGCHWRGSLTRKMCILRETGGSLELDLDQSGNKIEAVELIALVLDSKGRQAREVKSRNISLRIVAYFFPDWKERVKWMDIALSGARHEGSYSTITVERQRIVARWLQPADLDDTFVDITIEIVQS